MSENSKKIPEMPKPRISNEILSVLLIVSSDFYLQQTTRPFINLETQIIRWPVLFKLPLTESHQSAINWAFCIWRNEIPTGFNPFSKAFAMDQNLQKTILEALKFRWNNKG